MTDREKALLFDMTNSCDHEYDNSPDTTYLNDACDRCVLGALHDAFSRGRLAGIEEAAKVCDVVSADRLKNSADMVSMGEKAVSLPYLAQGNCVAGVAYALRALAAEDGEKEEKT